VNSFQKHSSSHLLSFKNWLQNAEAIDLEHNDVFEFQLHPTVSLQAFDVPKPEQRFSRSSGDMQVLSESSMQPTWSHVSAPLIREQFESCPTKKQFPVGVSFEKYGS
jgi:hypothetical protein